MSKLTINLLWIIGDLVLVVIVILAVKWSSITDLAATLNFALGLASLLLAIVAIVYGFISNNALSGVVGKIETAATGINDTARNLPARLTGIEKNTSEMREMLAASQAQPQQQSSPQTQLSPALAQPLPQQAQSDLNRPRIDCAEEIRQFMEQVIDTFLRTSSWNGLKIMHVCRTCLEKKIPFDLKEICSLDNSMSYDYAFGYLIASVSASFVVITTPDNITFHITMMPDSVVAKIPAAITGRLDYVGAGNALDFLSQLKRINDHIANMEVKHNALTAFVEGLKSAKEPPQKSDAV
jgi:hypothetical protein